MNPRILFLGTPDFAATALAALIEQNYNIIAVLTRPDKPKGRGHAMQSPPVKLLAQANDIPVFQPTTLKNGAFDDQIKELDPDLIVVAAYGMILPPFVIHYPKFGCINIHGSLLPRHRGAAPMQRAIMEGDSQTGITIMQMDEGLDTGDMLHVVTTPITDDDNFETIHDRMADLGAKALLEALPAILDGTIKATKQPENGATYAKKIEKTDALLDFSLDVRTLHNIIRGLSPIPLAFTYKGDTMLKIASAKICRYEGKHGVPGQVMSLLPGGFEVACGNGSLLVTEVVPAGKKRMKASDFVNGRGIAVGDLLGESSHEET